MRGELEQTGKSKSEGSKKVDIIPGDMAISVCGDAIDFRNRFIASRIKTEESSVNISRKPLFKLSAKKRPIAEVPKKWTAETNWKVWNSKKVKNVICQPHLTKRRVFRSYQEIRTFVCHLTSCLIIPKLELIRRIKGKGMSYSFFLG